jgi:hypothetical protein
VRLPSGYDGGGPSIVLSRGPAKVRLPHGGFKTAGVDCRRDIAILDVGEMGEQVAEVSSRTSWRGFAYQVDGRHVDVAVVAIRGVCVGAAAKAEESRETTAV